MDQFGQAAGALIHRSVSAHWSARAPRLGTHGLSSSSQTLGAGQPPSCSPAGFLLALGFDLFPLVLFERCSELM